MGRNVTRSATTFSRPMWKVKCGRSERRKKKHDYDSDYVSNWKRSVPCMDRLRFFRFSWQSAMHHSNCAHNCHQEPALNYPNLFARMFWFVRQSTLSPINSYEGKKQNHKMANGVDAKCKTGQTLYVGRCMDVIVRFMHLFSYVRTTSFVCIVRILQLQLHNLLFVFVSISDCLVQG